MEPSRSVRLWQKKQGKQGSEDLKTVKREWREMEVTLATVEKLLPQTSPPGVSPSCPSVPFLQAAAADTRLVSL